MIFVFRVCTANCRNQVLILLLVPAAFTVSTGERHWEILLRARAIENGAYVIAAAQCGTHDGDRKTYGHSMVVDPWEKSSQRQVRSQ
jgi:predicted amidohydrolase